MESKELKKEKTPFEKLESKAVKFGKSYNKKENIESAIILLADGKSLGKNKAVFVGDSETMKILLFQAAMSSETFANILIEVTRDYMEEKMPLLKHVGNAFRENMSFDPEELIKDLKGSLKQKVHSVFDKRMEQMEKERQECKCKSTVE